MDILSGKVICALLYALEQNIHSGDVFFLENGILRNILRKFIKLLKPVYGEFILYQYTNLGIKKRRLWY